MSCREHLQAHEPSLQEWGQTLRRSHTRNTRVYTGGDAPPAARSRGEGGRATSATDTQSRLHFSAALDGNTDQDGGQPTGDRHGWQRWTFPFLWITTTLMLLVSDASAQPLPSVERCVCCRRITEGSSWARKTSCFPEKNKETEQKSHRSSTTFLQATRKYSRPTLKALHEALPVNTSCCPTATLMKRRAASSPRSPIILQDGVFWCKLWKC